MRKLINLNVIVYAIAIVLYCSITMQANAQTFSVYNALLFKNTPDLSSQGLHKINIIYENQLLNFSPDKPADVNSKILSVNALKSRAVSLEADPNVPVCIDIESWNPRIGPLGTLSLNKYLDVLTKFKNYNPNSKIGLWSVMPFNDYILQYLSQKKSLGNRDPNANSYYSQWRKTNNFLKPIALKVDYSFPSFYGYYDNDYNQFEEHVKLQTQIVKGYNPRIKILGFIWPQYRLNGRGPYIYKTAERWRFELETLSKYCDGVVIWSSPTQVDGKAEYFDENKPWFQETLKFIKDHNLK